MTLDIFLMNMCVVVIALLIRREIKLKKARQLDYLSNSFLKIVWIFIEFF